MAAAPGGAESAGAAVPGGAAPATDDAPVMPAEILRLRHSIDNIDGALMYLLAERFKCTRRVGELKAAGGLPPEDLAREHEQIARLGQIAADAGLDPALAEDFRSFIVTQVKHHHALIAARGEGDVPPLDIYS